MTWCRHCSANCHTVSNGVGRLTLLRGVCRPLTNRTTQGGDDRRACRRQGYQGVPYGHLAFRRLRSVRRYLTRSKERRRRRERLYRLHLIITRRRANYGNATQAKGPQGRHTYLYGASSGNVLRTSILLLLQLVVVKRERRRDYRRRTTTRGSRSQARGNLCFILRGCPRGTSECRKCRCVSSMAYLLIRLPLRRSLRGPIGLFPRCRRHARRHDRVCRCHGDGVLLSLGARRYQASNRISTATRQRVFNRSLGGPGSGHFGPFRFIWIFGFLDYQENYPRTLLLLSF